MQTAKSCSHFDKANTHLDKDSDCELCALGREPFALFPLCTLLMPRAYAALRPCLTRSSLLACFASLNACLPILLTQHCHLSLSLLQFSPIGTPAFFTQHCNLFQPVVLSFSTYATIKKILYKLNYHHDENFVSS